MSTTAKKDQDELLETITESLTRISDAMASAVASDQHDPMRRLNAMMIGLTASTAAGLLQRLWREQQELEAAIQAAVESLEDVPDAGSVRVMLQAAIIGDAS